jgi:hypothetical protein
MGRTEHPAMLDATAAANRANVTKEQTARSLLGAVPFKLGDRLRKQWLAENGATYAL